MEKMKFTTDDFYTMSIDGYSGIELSNGIKIDDHHVQDWCEHVYADWSSLEDTDYDVREFKDVVLEFVEDVGFRINGYLINCYNEQNGYYSSNLELVVWFPDGREEIIDMSNYIEDRVYWLHKQPQGGQKNENKPR